MHRRSFNCVLAGGLTLVTESRGLTADPSDAASSEPSGSDAKRNWGRDHAAGLLIGGMIGDALGGPVEFTSAPSEHTGLADLRSWSDERKVNASDFKELAETLPINGYGQLRPSSAPYGPWGRRCPVGTVTDDTRHKIVLMQAVEAALASNRRVRQEDIARAFLEFRPRGGSGVSKSELEALNAEGFREYRMASRWLLGERDLGKARPIERLWGGINNCSGQMMFPPLAVLFQADAELAYRETFALDFIDAGQARDFVAALNAGLAASLDVRLVDASVETRWNSLLDGLRNTDPFGMKEIPFAGRPLDKWLSKSEELAEKAQGSPKQLYRLLETEGKPEYWWDAHFTLLVPLAILRFCEYSPLASLHMTLDFGHDTDSYAQVLGCLIGAIHGADVFPASIVSAVHATMKADYGQDINGWASTLERARELYQ